MGDLQPSPDDRSASEFVVEPAEVGQRLDQVLAARFPEFSRAHLRRAIDAGAVAVDRQQTKASYRLRAGQQVVLVPPELPREGPRPEPMSLKILYEDPHLVAIDKAPGVVVHPAKGHWSGTLTAGLAYHFSQLSEVGGPTRPGIVHRLDRDTSGVIVVAKTDTVHHHLACQFKDRTVEKEYLAIVCRVPELDQDLIDHPIGRHPRDREKMALVAGQPTSRAAQTRYAVRERFDGFALVAAFPKTGRTHQIRLHLASIGCPVLCDRLYGGRAELSVEELHAHQAGPTVILKRQALHAHRLRLTHPISGERLELVAPLPEDFELVLTQLRMHRSRTQ